MFFAYKSRECRTFINLYLSPAAVCIYFFAIDLVNLVNLLKYKSLTSCSLCSIYAVGGGEGGGCGD